MDYFAISLEFRETWRSNSTWNAISKDGWSYFAISLEAPNRPFSVGGAIALRLKSRA